MGRSVAFMVGTYVGNTGFFDAGLAVGNAVVGVRVGANVGDRVGDIGRKLMGLLVGVRVTGF